MSIITSQLNESPRFKSHSKKAKSGYGIPENNYRFRGEPFQDIATIAFLKDLGSSGRGLAF